MVQHFGVCAGCGVLSTMLLEMSLIPALRSLLRPPRCAKLAGASRPACWIAPGGLGSPVSRRPGGWFLGGGLHCCWPSGPAPCSCALTTTSSSMRSRPAQCGFHDGISTPPLGVQIRFQFLVQTQGQDGIKDPKVLQASADLQAFSKARRMSARPNRSPILSSA